MLFFVVNFFDLSADLQSIVERNLDTQFDQPLSRLRFCFSKIILYVFIAVLKVLSCIMKPAMRHVAHDCLSSQMFPAYTQPESMALKLLHLAP
jgi:hypothetical protein